MRVKTFEGKTEQDVLEKIKAEMGVDAVVLNIKKTNTSGFLGMFKGGKVEITAAIDNDKKSSNEKNVVSKDEISDFLKTVKSTDDIKNQNKPTDVKTTSFVTKNENNEDVKVVEQDFKSI